jgi:UDP-3-O-[3-hydroxymyristoyl] glucosamine N-acyltransferase
MSEPPLTASQIAASVDGSLEGPDAEVTGLGVLDSAAAGQLGFATETAVETDAAARAARNGAVLLVPHSAPGFAHGSVIRVDNPRGAFAEAVRRFFAPPVTPGVASTAIIHPTARIAASAHVGEYTVIEKGVVIGAGTEVRNHVVIAAGVEIGENCLIKSHAVIGEEGFGIDKDAAGDNVRLPHVGSVRIDDHVEIGAFTTICSGTILPTTIGHHTKIDDHVHVSHNCRIGENVIITACAEISGSTEVGDRAWLGPNMSALQGVVIGADALVGVGAVVTKSVPPGDVWFGNPARRMRSAND